MTLVTAPAADALSLEAAREHLGLTGITEHDDNIAGFIADALAQIEGPDGIGLCLIDQTWRLSLDAWPGCIVLPLGPVSAVSHIKYRDPDGVEQTLAADQYVYDLDSRPLRIWPAEGVSWPSLKVMPGAVKVTFVAGYGATAAAVPGDLIGALKLIVGHRFEHRGDDGMPPAAVNVLLRHRRGRAA